MKTTRAIYIIIFCVCLLLIAGMCIFEFAKTGTLSQRAIISSIGIGLASVIFLAKGFLRTSGAKTDVDAKTVAKSVITSTLFKAAMFGADANWGRVLCAIGYSGANVDVTKIDVAFESKKGRIEVCKMGSGIDFSEEIAKEILLEDEIVIDVNLNDGEYGATAWGCDLTYDYVKINGDYRT